MRSKPKFSQKPRTLDDDDDNDDLVRITSGRNEFEDTTDAKVNNMF
jgi:hypothetical protein